MQKLFFLDRVTDSTVLSDRCREELVSALTVHTLGEDHELPAHLQPAEQLLLITSGIARVFVITNDGKDVTQYFARAEDFVTTLHHESPGAERRVQAITDISYVALPKVAFERLLVAYPEMSTFLGSFLSDEALRARDRKARRERAEAVDSYASFLQAYPGLETQVPTIHLASYLGLTPSQFMRARQKYRERGLM